MSRGIETHAVDPARLSHGEWDPSKQEHAGEGDIVASYSADRIGIGQPIRRPFPWRGGLWVCTGIGGRRGFMAAEAYRLVDPTGFRGEPVTYAEKTREAEAARNDPLGFYHGMLVRCRGREFVLSGPAVRFVAREPDRAGLFEQFEARDWKER